MARASEGNCQRLSKKDASESDISHYAPDKMVAKLKHDYDVFVTKLDETKSTNPDAKQTQQI